MPAKEGMTRVTLFLDPVVAKQFQVLAAQTGKDRSTLVTEWVRYVASQTAERS